MIEEAKRSGEGFTFEDEFRASWNGLSSGGRYCEINVEKDFSLSGWINSDSWGVSNLFHHMAAQFCGVIKLSIVETNYKHPSADWATENGQIDITSREIIDARQLNLPTNTWELIEKEYQLALKEVTDDWQVKKEVDKVIEEVPCWTNHYDVIENLSSLLRIWEDNGEPDIEELLFHELGQRFHDRLRAVPAKEMISSWAKDRHEQGNALRS